MNNLQWIGIGLILLIVLFMLQGCAGYDLVWGYDYPK